MYTPTEAHAKGLDGGMDVALKMLNETLGIQATTLGQALSHVETMRRQLDRMKKELADWK
jgi:hypothetical protein